MTSTSTMKPIMMNTSSDVADDPFADLPALATNDATFSSPPPQLVSPLEFGTGIKYLQEQQQQQQETSKNENSVAIEKVNDVTETTVADDSDDTIEETPIEATSPATNE
jgi:hypothetical protein